MQCHAARRITHGQGLFRRPRLHLPVLQVMHYYKDNLMAFKKGDWSPEEDAALLKVPPQRLVPPPIHHACLFIVQRRWCMPLQADAPATSSCCEHARKFL